MTKQIAHPEPTKWYAVTPPPIHTVSDEVRNRTAIDIMTHCTADSLKAATETIAALYEQYPTLCWEETRALKGAVFLIASGKTKGGHEISLIVHNLCFGGENEGSEAAADILAQLGFGKKDELFRRLSQPDGYRAACITIPTKTPSS